MSRPSVSAKDVADLAGVSRASVSRALTPGATISHETRARVVAAAEKLGYQVNRLASGLIRNETGIIALIASEIGTPYRAQLLGALTEKLQQAGKVTLLINTDRSDESVERALRQAISYRTDAAIFLSGMPAWSLAETCQKNGMRLVLINRDEARPGSVLVRLDDRAAGERAVALLLAAGCRRLALASSEAGTPSLIARESGFRDAVRAAGLDLVEERIGVTSYRTGLELGTRLMARSDRPDGVFCTTDLMACGLMDAARFRFGVEIPRALSVIGFDDIAQAGWESYALTSFGQPIDKIAGAATDWLQNPAETAAARITLSASLVWRNSVRQLHQPHNS
ncbi:LacI family DNA-binding transcriptional regulator [Paracoccus cavernae]|uniref:LacI family DNA-binding transcriptional regulator n=1 Tax=Paracoccus cavernae TaxID=1571207 RepID=A0ABT8DAD6_9RHOB|nr:LacI family DNA-binding transcriptional regulator [Paracoccus cavernae]